MLVCLVVPHLRIHPSRPKVRILAWTRSPPMSRYDQFPMYSLALDFRVFFERAVQNLSRYHKYGIGESLPQGLWELITRQESVAALR